MAIGLNKQVSGFFEFYVIQFALEISGSYFDMHGKRCRLLFQVCTLDQVTN